MKYEVIHPFKDLKDKNYVYQVGDKYPRKGKVHKERAEELQSNHNRLGVPLIRIVEEGE